MKNWSELAQQIKQWGIELGFQQIGITDTELATYTARFNAWLAKGHHGSMTYMEKHGSKRYQPAELIPDTLRVISARLDYLPPNSAMLATLKQKDKAYISRYAVGRDYHRVLRKRLTTLAEKIQTVAGPFGYRAFCDSAPVLEKPLAEKAGLGWIGKHTNLINAKAGSWFFLGELYTTLPLPIDTAQNKSHCGSCTACLTICPTQAIIAPYELDARRCISYLTIELAGAIPIEFRKAIGNRIYGCDDCQLICPWNKFAKVTKEIDFYPRHQLNDITLAEIFTWTEAEFLRKTEGSAIRRIGYDNFLRNIAVALGNAATTPPIIAALKSRLQDTSDLVKEHILWALDAHASNIN